MAQIDGAGQQDTDDQNAETLQAALAQRQVTLQGQPQGGSDVPSHENSDPVSDESEILRSRQPLTGKRRVPWSRTVNLSHLACMFPTRAAIASNYRRLQRFFEQVIVDGSQLARVIVRIAGVGSGPWLLALDRTCWTFGRYDINVLMLAIIHNGIAIPVMWDVLGRAGNSTTAQRSALLSRFCAVFGEAAIAGLIAH